MHPTRSRRGLPARSPPISQEFNKYLNLKGRYPDTDGELTTRKGKRRAPTPFAATALDEIGGADREVARDDEAAHQLQIARQAQMAAKKLQRRHAEQAEEQARRRAHAPPRSRLDRPLPRPSHHHPAISARSRQAEIAQLEARLKEAKARRLRRLADDGAHEQRGAPPEAAAAEDGSV